MKKETILKSVILAFMAMSATNVCGQTTWVYSYDSTGNRTQRVVNNGAKARQRTELPNFQHRLICATSRRPSDVLSHF